MRRISLLAAMIFGAGAIAAVAGASTKGTSLTLVAYSTPKTVLGKLISAWQQTPDGKDVSFNQSYGGSGDQTRAVIAGQKADIVFLALGSDMDALADAGVVDKNWDKQGYKGIVADSVVSFVFRSSNPKHIRSWNDLVKPGVQVVTANPFASGGARWNILAAYASQRQAGKTDKQARAFVLKLFQHVVSQDSSARNATNTFLSGKGDVLLNYESEAIAAQQAGQNLSYLVPGRTMLIELPIAVTKNSQNRDKAIEFIRYLKSESAQEVFAQYGFRPVNKQAAKKSRSKYPTKGIITINNKMFGGWRAAQKRWFDPKTGLMVGIEKSVGGPTG
jgi:sulfate/thiosulfate transport system substrate-binding protein